ncbi:glycosyltransferase [Alteromonas sp. BMJM2]|uniref:glycosyltransferase n=1 Tax=Alteromonas sp. BMJM2 TaxID=2954241 RepID=UPI0022B35C0A|nr:glycosyltransferase [Alteromonas sp. BMJM2]
MEISVIIPSYNTQNVIADTLESVVNQSANFDFEVIVVDCSENEQVKNVVESFPNVLFHHETERFNPGIGRNIGAKLAKSDLLIFLDADVILERNALSAALKEYRSGKKMFGGALELNKQKSKGVAGYVEHYFFNHESQPGRKEQERKNLSSAFMCADKAVFLNAGGFKNIARMQDTELTERLVAKGIKLYFCPALVALQTQDSPIKSVFRKIFINGRNLYSIRYKENTSTTKSLMLFVLLPLMALAKGMRIVMRHLKYQTLKNKIKTVLLAPLLLLGAFVWMVGFYYSMIFGLPISKTR